MHPPADWSPPASLRQVDHPLVQSRLATLRDAETPPAGFRTAVHEVSKLLLFEATRDLESRAGTVTTPLADAPASHLERPVTFVPVLRAGLGMLTGMLDMVPDAKVGHVGLARDEETTLPAEYYRKLPPDIAGTDVLVLDPMLATGGSVRHTFKILEGCGVSSVRLVCILASRQGVEALAESHPGVPVIAAAVDPTLDENAFIVPGLGDAGDRYFGTVPVT